MVDGYRFFAAGVVAAGAAVELVGGLHLAHLAQDGQDLGLAGPDEGFHPDGREVAARDLRPDHASEARDRGMLDLDPRVIALVGEGGGDFAVVDLVMGVVGVAAAQADARESGELVVICGSLFLVGEVLESR